MTRKTQRKSDLLGMALDLHRRLVEAEAKAVSQVQLRRITPDYIQGNLDRSDRLIEVHNLKLAVDDLTRTCNTQANTIIDLNRKLSLLATPAPRALSWIKVEREDQVPVGTVLWNGEYATEVAIPSLLVGRVVCILALPSEIPAMPKGDV